MQCPPHHTIDAIYVLCKAATLTGKERGEDIAENINTLKCGRRRGIHLENTESPRNDDTKQCVVDVTEIGKENLIWRGKAVIVNNGRGFITTGFTLE